MKVPLSLERYFDYVIAVEAERAVRDFLTENGPAIPPPAIDFHRGEDAALELSIVLPVWNPQEAHLRRCLESLRKADFNGLSHEIVVSDDASATPTAQDCLARSGLPQAHYVRQGANLGGFGNFNWCIGAARGRWIHLLHQDDWIEPGFYQELLRGAAAESGAELRYCRTRLYYEERGETGAMFDEAPEAGILPDFFQRQCVSQRIQISGAIMARAAVARVGGYDPRLGTGGDWEFWARWGRSHRVFYSPRQLATFSLHGGSWGSREESLAAHLPVLRRILGYVPVARRREVASGFMASLVARLVGIARRNKQTGRIGQNRAVAGALLTASKDAGLLPDIETVLASLN
ncbi:MAG: glycosyltransferase [Opitutae bacterium]|nr:glycosyltransferase [Opitutae bacterium]